MKALSAQRDRLKQSLFRTIDVPVDLSAITDIDAASDHSNGTRGKRTGMSGRVDPAGQAGDNEEAGLTQLLGNFLCKGAAIGAGIPGADDANCRLLKKYRMSFYAKHWRRII